MTEDKSYREGYRDALNYAIVLARKYCNSDELVLQLEKEMNTDQNEKLLKLDFGKSYIIYEKENKTGMRIISNIASKKNPVIVISRDINSNIRDLSNVKYAIITYDEIEGGFNPNELSRLQEFILNNVSEKTVLYIDCIDYFISVNQNHSNVLKFVSLIKDRIIKMRGIMLISMNQDVIEKSTFSFLEKELKNIIKIKKTD